MLCRHALAGLLACLLPFAGACAAEPVTVFAAASLTEAMRDVSAPWQQAGHAPLRLSFASSSTLARQIDQGGPANVFAAASRGAAVAGVFPQRLHDRITYPFAVTRDGDTPEARALLLFLAGPDVRTIFERREFIVMSMARPG